MCAVLARTYGLDALMILLFDVSVSVLQSRKMDRLVFYKGSDTVEVTSIEPELLN